MSDTSEPETSATKKSSKLPLIIGLVLACAGGAGGFTAVQMGYLNGIIGGGSQSDAQTEKSGATTAIETSFVEVPPITITLANPERMTHLRFRVSLEVPSEYEAEVTRVIPRMQDVMNSYLRALEGGDFEEPSSLFRVRSQLLRRLQLVAGKDRVRDLLVLEFVLT